MCKPLCMENEGPFVFSMHHFIFVNIKMRILREHFGKCELLSGTFARGFLAGVSVIWCMLLLRMNQNVHLV